MKKKKPPEKAAEHSHPEAKTTKTKEDRFQKGKGARLLGRTGKTTLELQTRGEGSGSSWGRRLESKSAQGTWAGGFRGKTTERLEKAVHFRDTWL